MLCEDMGFTWPQDSIGGTRQIADTCRMGNCAPDSRQGCRQLHLVVIEDAVAEGVKPPRTSTLQRKHEGLVAERYKAMSAQAAMTLAISSPG